MKPYYQDNNIQIYHVDCREILTSLADFSAVVTDPPYGLGFMGKEWDIFDKTQFGHEGLEGANDLKVKKNFKILPRYRTDGLYNFIFDCFSLIRKSCLPGGPLLSFGGSRTQHRMACAIEDAGWEIRDTLMWVYGSGFPKSLDISKAIDKQQGTYVAGDALPSSRTTHGNMDFQMKEKTATNPQTPEAQLWEGYGTALKPAYEPIILAMNPLDGTFANNALKHKVAGLNIDECRIPINPKSEPDVGDAYYLKRGLAYPNQGVSSSKIMGGKTDRVDITMSKGRFPANFLHDGSQMVMELFPETSKGYGVATRGKAKGDGSVFGIGGINPNRYDMGGQSAARFFYCAKSSKRERGEGNNHATVKPLALMEYLCKLVKMPEYNLILDPFCGSGTTLLACIKLGIPCIGVDSDESSCEIAARRCSQEVMEF